MENTLNYQTHIAEQVYEGIIGAVGHRQPVTAKPDDVDVRIPAVQWLASSTNLLLIWTCLSEGPSGSGHRKAGVGARPE